MHLKIVHWYFLYYFNINILIAFKNKNAHFKKCISILILIIVSYY